MQIQTKHWSMALWRNIMDICTLNAFITYKAQHPMYHEGLLHKRRLFIKELSMELIQPFVIRSYSFLQKSILLDKEKFITIPETRNNSSNSNSTVGRLKKSCLLCPASKVRKTKTVCSKCSKRVPGP